MSTPRELHSRSGIRRDPADREDLARGIPAVRGKQADGQHGVDDRFHRGPVGLAPVVVSVTRYVGCLEDHLQIDRYGVLPRGDDVLLMHVHADEAVEERKPRTGSSEEPRKVLRVSTTGVINKFGPAVAFSRQDPHGPEVDRGVAVQFLDQRAPRYVDTQILGLVHDAGTVFEADDADSATEVVRVGKIALDRGYAARARRAGTARDESPAGRRRDA